MKLGKSKPGLPKGHNRLQTKKIVFGIEAVAVVRVFGGGQKALLFIKPDRSGADSKPGGRFVNFQHGGRPFWSFHVFINTAYGNCTTAPSSQHPDLGGGNQGGVPIASGNNIEVLESILSE
ncbi:hypothetical protein D3C73_1334120 [compost metagenome]